MTIIILVAGVVLVLALAARPERDREALMAPVQVGDAGDAVARMLGSEPLRCPGHEVAHLRESFPNGWSDAGIDVALERLGGLTAERWVFATDGDPPELCGDRGRRTEIGVDSAGAVVWFVPVLGRSRVRLPAWLQPGGDAGAPPPQRRDGTG